MVQETPRNAAGEMQGSTDAFQDSKHCCDAQSDDLKASKPCKSGCSARESWSVSLCWVPQSFVTYYCRAAVGTPEACDKHACTSIHNAGNAGQLRVLETAVMSVLWMGCRVQVAWHGNYGVVSTLDG